MLRRIVAGCCGKLTEGLACRVTQAFFPDHPETDCIEARPDGLKEATGRREAILKGISRF